MKFEGEAELAPCPAPEALAAYIDHGLSLTERNRIEAHLARCEGCAAQVARVVEMVLRIAKETPWKD